MLKVRVSDAIVSQNPGFIEHEHPMFNKFIQEYYRYLEQQSQDLSIIRDVKDNIDVDRTRSDFLEKLKTLVLPVSVDNTTPIISDEELIKVLRELYLTKGTEDSLLFIMKKLFGNDSAVDYGRNFVLRPSDNEYIGQSEMIVKNVVGNDYDLKQLIGSEITQNKAYAIIDRVEFYPSPIVKSSLTASFTADSNQLIVNSSAGLVIGDFLEADTYLARETQVTEISGNVVTLSKLTLRASPTIPVATPVGVNALSPYYKCYLDRKDVRNEFTEGEATTKIYVNNVPQYLDVYVVSCITNFKIIEPGSLYVSGQNVDMVGGDGANVRIKVGEISSGKLEEVIVVEPGTGYIVGNQFEVKSLDGYGVDAEVEVEAVDGYGAELAPVVTINSITLNGQLRNYAALDILELNIPDMYGIKPSYTVDTVAGGLPGDLNWVPSVTTGGLGYPSNSKIHIVDGVTEVEIIPVLDVNGAVLPDTFADFIPNTTWAAPVISINGSGAHGEVTIASKTITAVTPTDQGEYYVNPILRLYSDALFTIEVKGNHPQWNYYDALGDMDLTIDGAFQGYFDVADGTYYYKIDEMKGEGCTLSVDNLTYITAVTPVYTGFYDTEVTAENITTSTDNAGYAGTVNVDYVIDSIKVINPGINYLSPIIDINGADGSAIATAIISDENVISDTKILTGGKGYFNATLSVKGDGSGFVATPVLSGTIEELKVLNKGSGYTTVTVTITGDGVDATADATITGSIDSVTVTDGGSGYTTATVTITGDGAGAAATATIVGNVITGINVTDGGSGYTTATVTITGDGVDATADATIIGEIIGYNMTNKGTGYTDADVSIVGDGIDADAMAIGGKVIGVTITNMGINWKNATFEVVSVDTVHSKKGAGAKILPVITPKSGILSVTVI